MYPQDRDLSGVKAGDTVYRERWSWWSGWGGRDVTYVALKVTKVTTTQITTVGTSAHTARWMIDSGREVGGNSQQIWPHTSENVKVVLAANAADKKKRERANLRREILLAIEGSAFEQVDTDALRAAHAALAPKGSE